MNENIVWRYEDEPPHKVQNVKSNDNSNRSPKHSLGYLYRLLLWRGAILHRSGRFMCPGSGFSSRWLNLVLGNGEYERKNGERVG